MLKYVSEFREHLHCANSFAKQTLLAAQTKMKWRYDLSTSARSFQVGDKMLALLPVPGSSLSAKFSGPHVVLDRLSDTDYVIDTPERRKSRVCHVNMLKEYISRSPPVGPGAPSSGCDTALVVSGFSEPPAGDELELRPAPQMNPRCQILRC